jgi:hypothetical protein
LNVEQGNSPVFHLDRLHNRSVFGHAF